MTVTEFASLMLSVFPDATWDIDNDAQLIIYTGLQYLTPEDNPSIPEGEIVIQKFED